TVRAATAAAALDARRRSASTVARDRRRRAQRLADGVLPLLAAIADGTTDPGTPQTRAACTAQAATLRRILTTTGTSNKLAELETAVEAAEDRGLRVEVQVGGDLSVVPLDVRDEVFRAVDRTLLAVPAGTALLTVLTTDVGGSVYLTFPAQASAHHVPALQDEALQDEALQDVALHDGPASPASPQAGGPRGRTSTRTDVSDGQAYLEVSWDVPPTNRPEPVVATAGQRSPT
nr:hypothetical protein [Micromonospora sp. DSM 115978]